METWLLLTAYIQRHCRRPPTSYRLATTVRNDSSRSSNVNDDTMRLPVSDRSAQKLKKKNSTIINSKRVFHFWPSTTFDMFFFGLPNKLNISIFVTSICTVGSSCSSYLVTNAMLNAANWLNVITIFTTWQVVTMIINCWNSRTFKLPYLAVKNFPWHKKLILFKLLSSICGHNVVDCADRGLESMYSVS